MNNKINESEEMYASGQAVEQDEQAIWRFRQAADQGYVKAQFRLGMMYYRGRGVKKNYPMAMQWFQKAADQGDVESLTRLEKLQGRDVP